jgi:hypothetical protein
MTKYQQTNIQIDATQDGNEPTAMVNSLDTVLFDGHEHKPINPHAPPEGPFSHWLSVDQIRRMQRMRRQTVIDAMDAGDLPFEQRGRIRYARLSDVLLWEERRLSGSFSPSIRCIDADFADLAG